MDPHTIIAVAHALDDIGALPHPFEETTVDEVSDTLEAIVVMMERTVVRATLKALESTR